MELIESYIALWHKLIPFSDWEGRVVGVEANNEVVFTCFKGAFVGVVVMVLRGNGLKFDAVLVKIEFEFVGSLVINVV